MAGASDTAGDDPEPQADRTPPTGGDAGTAAPKRLRYGIVLDEPAPTMWQAAVIEHLDRSGAAELALVVLADHRHGGRGRRQGSAPGPSPAGRLGSAVLEAFSARLSRSRAMQPCHPVPWPAHVPVVRTSPVLRGQALAFRDSDVRAITAHGPDVLLWLGSGNLAGGLLEAARHGVWSFQHGDTERQPFGPPGFWELVNGAPVIGVSLQRLAPAAAGAVILRRGWFAASPESYGRTRDRLLLGAASWPALACREILLRPSMSDWRPAPMTAIPRRDVSFRAFVRLLAGIGRARLRKLWHHGLRHDDWNIGVIQAPVETFRDGGDLPAVAWAPVRRGRYAADPFGRWDGAALDVFYEDYAHARGAASIARRRWSREHGWARSEPALDIGTHLSYPFLFEHDGRSFLLPESRATGRLVLYTSSDPGGTWRPEATLGLDGDVADATLLRHGDLWWLFAARPDRLNPSTELGIWFARRPEGPWQEHPLNPVLVDVRSARPAGPCFSVGGQLYRPAQDCSTGYGDRVVVKRITVLTTERFAEEPVGVVRPNPAGAFPYGVHTLTGVGPVTLVDGKRRVWDTAALIRAILGRLHR